MVSEAKSRSRAVVFDDDDSDDRFMVTAEVEVIATTAAAVQAYHHHQASVFTNLTLNAVQTQAKTVSSGAQSHRW